MYTELKNTGSYADQQGQSGPADLLEKRCWLELYMEPILQLPFSVPDQSICRSEVRIPRLGSNQVVRNTTGLVLATGNRTAIDAVDRRSVGLVCAEVSMIEHVKEVDAELHRDSFFNSPVFIQGEVCID